MPMRAAWRSDLESCGMSPGFTSASARRCFRWHMAGSTARGRLASCWRSTSCYLAARQPACCPGGNSWTCVTPGRLDIRLREQTPDIACAFCRAACRELVMLRTHFVEAMILQPGERTLHVFVFPIFDLITGCHKKPKRQG